MYDQILNIAKSIPDFYLNLNTESGLNIDKKYPFFLYVIYKEHTYCDKYHDFNHLYGCGLLAQHLCFKNSNQKDKNKYREYHESELLIISALLHDFNYENCDDDQENIRQTNWRLCELYDQFRDSLKKDKHTHWSLFDLINFHEITRNIQYSCYRSDWNKVNIQELEFQIIRDVDQLYSSVFISDELYEVLYSSFGKYKINDDGWFQSEEDFIYSQIKRLNNLKLYNKESKKLFKSIKPKVIDFYHKKLGRI